MLTCKCMFKISLCWSNTSPQQRNISKEKFGSFMKNTRQYQRLTVSFIHTRKRIAKTKAVWSGIWSSLQGSHLSKKDHSGKLPRLVLSVNTSKGRNVSSRQGRHSLSLNKIGRLTIVLFLRVVFNLWEPLSGVGQIQWEIPKKWSTILPFLWLTDAVM